MHSGFVSSKKGTLKDETPSGAEPLYKVGEINSGKASGGL